MTRGPLLTVLASLPIIFLSGPSFDAQTSASQHTLTFAELTYGTDITAMAPDGAGGAWFVGNTCSTTLPTTAGAVQRTQSTGCHGLIGRMTANGAIAYLSYLGGTQGYDRILALAVDASGNVYAGGATSSPDFPTTAAAYDRICGDDGTCMTYKNVQGSYLYTAVSDGFVTKLSPSGDRILYSTFVGGRDDDSITGVAVDATGRIHVSGSTYSLDFPVTAAALKSAYEGTSDPDGNPYSDAFYARLSVDGGSLQYATYLGGAEPEDNPRIAVDVSGDAYVAGTTRSLDFPVQNAPRPTNTSTGEYPNQSADGFLARFGDAGVVYSTFVGGSSTDWVNDVAVSGDRVFLGGWTCSPDFAGGTDATPNDCEGLAASADAATGAVVTAVTLKDSTANAIAVDANRVVYLSGYSGSAGTFPTTPDAYQRNYGGNSDAFLSVVDFGAETPSLLYSTYLGGGDADRGNAVAPDGSGGAFFGGSVSWLKDASPTFPSHTSQLQPAAEPVPSWGTWQSQSFAAHVGVVQGTVGGGGSDIVLYARDATATAGTWQLVADTTAAGGARIWNPDRSAPKLTTAAAAPANYFELTFQAQAGVPYHLWMRMKADSDSWQNDSVFVQFSDSVDAAGNPAWRLGTTGATVVSLEDCSGCGEHGWGWNDNGYGTTGTPVTFATSGTHTLRVQQREDGISIDQIVLSSDTYISSAPGAAKDDSTILDATPTADLNEVVVYGGDASATAGTWQKVSDTTAAGGGRIFNPDAGVAKITTAAASPATYFEVTFNAQAGVPYHLWLRMNAQNDSWQNDSIFAQFSDSVDGSGNPVWRIGSTSATVVSLEDCSGCGEQSWGWNDNGYGTPGARVTFATSGPHTMRIQQREDGISIDQIVLSAAKYLEQAPGAAKNDTTIVPR